MALSSHNIGGHTSISGEFLGFELSSFSAKDAVKDVFAIRALSRPLREVRS